MYHVTATILLLLSPTSLVAILIALLWFIRDWRRSWGAQRQLPAAAVVTAVAFLVIHSGYFLAPLLHWTGHAALALWLVTLVALVASVCLMWHVLFNMRSHSLYGDERLAWKMRILLALLTVYLLPVAVLMMVRSA